MSVVLIRQMSHICGKCSATAKAFRSFDMGAVAEEDNSKFMFYDCRNLEQLWTIVARGNYTGSKSVKFTVYDADTKTFFTSAGLEEQEFVYTGKAIKPKVTVISANTETLQYNKDYKVQYQNNVNVGTGYVIVTGKGQCKGKVLVPFEITPPKVSTVNMTIANIPDKVYSGTLQKPTVTVKTGKKKLAKNKDYTITYEDNLHASMEGKKAKVTKASVKGTMETLTLTYKKAKLREGSDYTVTPDVSGAKKNRMKITITGLGDFAGSTVTKNVKVN